jgi:hypothetical protein
LVHHHDRKTINSQVDRAVKKNGSATEARAGLDVLDLTTIAVVEVNPSTRFTSLLSFAPLPIDGYTRMTYNLLPDIMTSIVDKLTGHQS